jgi:alpha-mannosidase
MDKEKSIKELLDEALVMEKEELIKEMVKRATEEMRMDAYYYSFERTGVLEIDLILSAVAWAGKAQHSTEEWTENAYGGNTSPVEWIQIAANDAAKQWKETHYKIKTNERNRIRGELSKLLREVEEKQSLAWEEMPNEFGDHEVYSMELSAIRKLMALIENGDN